MYNHTSRYQLYASRKKIRIAPLETGLREGGREGGEREKQKERFITIYTKQNISSVSYNVAFMLLLCLFTHYERGKEMCSRKKKQVQKNVSI